MLLVLCLLALAVCMLRLLVDRPPGGTLSLAWPGASWMEFRRTAMIAAAIVGGCLGLAGALLQSMLRNPLASPFILGVSSGAGLGLMVAAWLSYITVGTAMTLPGSGGVPALLGAMLALSVVYLLGQRKGWPDPVALVLVGVIVSTVAAGGMMFFQHLVPTGLRGAFATWLMGTIPEVMPSWRLWLFGSICLGCWMFCQRLSSQLDASLMGDDESESVGVPLGRLRLLLLACAGALTAVAVTIAGPIAFVGLVAPHMARLLVGGRHVLLLPGAMACGIILLVGADALRQAIDLGGGRMPVGVLTTVCGGFIFLFLLRMEMRRT